MNLKLLNSEKGFTLIEVVIVLVIMTFISLGIYQMTTETYKLRDSLAAEGEFYNGIRMSMDVVQRDVAAMFSPIISKPNPKPSPSIVPGQPFNPNQAPDPRALEEAQFLAQSDLGKTSTFWLGATEKSGLRATRFVGTSNKMSFVSASHVRIYKDKPESDFAKITYELIRDEEFQDAQALLRTENPNVFDDDERRSERSAAKFVILHGIKKLRFRYWRKDRDNGLGRWETSWDSDKEDFKEKYPDIVEITVEIEGPDKLSFAGTYKFRPEVPLRGLVPST